MTDDPPFHHLYGHRWMSIRDGDGESPYYIDCECGWRQEITGNNLVYDVMNAWEQHKADELAAWKASPAAQEYERQRAEQEAEYARQAAETTDNRRRELAELFATIDAQPADVQAKWRMRAENIGALIRAYDAQNQLSIND